MFKFDSDPKIMRKCSLDGVGPYSADIKGKGFDLGLVTSFQFALWLLKMFNHSELFFMNLEPLSPFHLTNLEKYCSLLDLNRESYYYRSTVST